MTAQPETFRTHPRPDGGAQRPESGPGLGAQRPVSGPGLGVEARTAAELRAMRRALALAANGPALGANPQVGCVLLDESGATVAEGWHRGAGTPHAEVDALSKVVDASGLTAVVTLEPCNHTGRTGPCSEALIAARIRRVVFAVADPGGGALAGNESREAQQPSGLQSSAQQPSAQYPGGDSSRGDSSRGDSSRGDSSGGAERLREAGVDVEEGLLAVEAEDRMHEWLTAATHRRPYVTVKWASSLDGRIAAADGSSQWITGTAARQRVHEQRAASDAILVGTGTILSDDPSLTARGDAGELMPDQPLPVVLGERAIPGDAALWKHPRGLVETHSRDLSATLGWLFDQGIRRAFVEGGPTLTSALVGAGLVDEYLIYLAPTLIGGPHTAIGDAGVSSIRDALALSITAIERLGDDVLVTARPRQGH